jgi:hypothetical protein
MKYILIALTLFLTACGESEQQRLYRQQQQLAQQQQQLNYQQQQMAQQHQGWEQPQYQQGYAPAPIVQQPAPVIVQQPSSSGSSHMTDMLVGGLVGHAIGNAMGNRSAPAYNHPPAPVTNITRNVTINRAPVARPSAARRR